MSELCQVVWKLSFCCLCTLVISYIDLEYIVGVYLILYVYGVLEFLVVYVCIVVSGGVCV